MTRLLPPPPKSLRRRLVLGVTLLATAAVLASQAVGFVVLRSWLLDRVDAQLVEFHPPAPAFQDAHDGTLRVRGNAWTHCPRTSMSTSTTPPGAV